MPADAADDEVLPPAAVAWLRRHRGWPPMTDNELAEAVRAELARPPMTENVDKRDGRAW